MRQIVQRVENAVAEPALPGRRAHAIEKERKLWFFGSRVVLMIARVHFSPCNAATVQAIEQRTKPVGMLIVDGDWLAQDADSSARLVFNVYCSHSSSHAVQISLYIMPKMYDGIVTKRSDAAAGQRFRDAKF